jgi:rubrerythrin
MTDEEIQAAKLNEAGHSMRAAISALLVAANVGERSFWHAARQAREAGRLWDAIWGAPACSKCGGSGGGDDPVLVCPACKGGGLELIR